MKGDKFMIWVPQKLTEVSDLRLLFFSFIVKARAQSYVSADTVDP